MSLSGTNLLKAKDYNVAVVLNLIRKSEPISRREIAAMIPPLQQLFSVPRSA